MTAVAIATCKRCDSPIETGDLRCAVCAQVVPFEKQTRPETTVVVVRCDGCGAAMQYDEKVGAPSCAFCGSVTHLEEQVDPIEQTEFRLHFTVDEQAARSRLRSWMGKLGFFRPGDLQKRANITGLKPLWWVGWVFDAKALVSWAADSNAGSRRSNWAPHSGQVEMDFENLVVSASRGLSDQEVVAMIGSYRIGDGDAQGNGPVDVVTERFDVQRSAARQKITEAANVTAAARVQAKHIPGSSFRNVKTSLVLSSLVTRRCAFPAYVMAYRYRNKLYRAVINAQDDTCIIGKAPYSFSKILLVGATIIGAIVGAVLLLR